MKGGATEELAKPPPGGFDLKPIPEKHNSLSAALQASQDESAEAAEIQQEINQRGGGYIPPGESPPGTIEVEGSTVLDKDQNKGLTAIREIQMQAAVDVDNDGKPQTGGRRKKRRKKSKKRRWPKRKKTRKKRRRKRGGDPHRPNTKQEIMNKLGQKGYKHFQTIQKVPNWNPYNKKFTAPRKQIELRFRHHFEGDKKSYGGKRRRKTRRGKKKSKRKTRRKK